MARYILANWKSNKTRAEAQQWFQRVSKGLDASLKAGLAQQDVEVIVAPPFPLVPMIADAVTEFQLEHFSCGVQTISPYPAGSYTGAVSVRNLEGLDVSYAIVGHSEERHYFHVTSQDVAKQVELCVQAGITPVVCVDTPYLKEQATAIDPSVLPEVIVAYEPVSAIGTGDNQPVAEVAEVVARVRALFGNVPVLYGGSVTESSVAEYLEVTDGVLVGGASLDPDQFLAVLKASC